MKANWFTVASIAYIAIYIGMAIGSVGTVSNCTNEPQEWDTVYLITAMLVPLFLLAYVAGRESNKESNK